MLRIGFILLRVATGVASLLAMAAATFMLLVTSVFGLVKDGFHIGMTMARFFASRLRDPGSPPAPDPLVSLSMAGFAAVFLLMFVSVFLPERRLFLHAVAALAAVACIWRGWRMATVPDTSGMYFFAFALWFVYYIVSLRRVAQ